MKTSNTIRIYEIFKIDNSKPLIYDFDPVLSTVRRIHWLHWFRRVTSIQMKVLVMAPN